jgi:hypothetical protein
MTTARKPNDNETAMLILLLDQYCTPKGIDPFLAMVEVVNRLNQFVEKKAGEELLGSRKIYPMGKPLNEDDLGLTASKIEKRSDGIIYFNFGKICINWLALTSKQAKVVARQLVEVADEPTPPAA